MSMKPRLIRQPESPSPAEQRITAAFEEAGYIVTPTAKGRYYQGMANLMGGLEALALLRDEHMLNLLSNAQLRKGTAHTFKELRGVANPRQHFNRFVEQLHLLTGRGVFFRGYRLQCPVCDLDAWYAMTDVGERVTCQGCRSVFQMPLEHPFAYRPNQLFTQGLKEGALTVLLTVLWLAGRCMGEMAWQSGLVLKRDGHSAEIDLVALCDGALMLAECKDNFDDGETIIDQLERNVAVARAVNARTFLFATLRESAPDSVSDFLREAGNDSLDVRLVRRELLLMGDG